MAKNPQAEAIRKATVEAVLARNRYAESVVRELTDNLAEAEAQVGKAILKYRTLGSLPDNKLAALKGLEKLQADIRDITANLKKRQSLIMRQATKESFRRGISGGIRELAMARMPFYRDLTPEGIDKLATKAFTLVDTDALDFLVNYNLSLSGDVSRELGDGIKRVILNGVATGKGAEDIVRDLGHVIKDPESFRHAGSKVFSKAQYRMDTIARTEVIRSHNQGRIKFHHRVGVQKSEWLTMEDERVCPVCGPLDGKVFPTDKFPNIPAHPQCRCQALPAYPLVICGADMKAEAKYETGDACILPPQAIESQAEAKAKEAALLKQSFESGDPAQLNALSSSQLRTLAMQNGITISRPKSDLMKLLAQAEPYTDHSGLGGLALKEKLQQHGISTIRTKDEILSLLLEKQSMLQQAQQIADQAAKLPLSGGLHDLSAAELKDMAKSKGISLNMTKQDTIELLDKLEPGVDHSGLMGKELITAKTKHGIGVLKNKDQLIQALEKSAGEELAEKAKKEAMEAATKEAVQKAKQAVSESVENVVLPQSPGDYAHFVSSIQKAEDALAQAGVLPQETLEVYAKELALKKNLVFQQVSGMKSSRIKNLAKEAKLTHWQWANKDEMITLLTETDPGKISAAKASIESKHAAWKLKHGGGKKASAPTPTPKPTPKPTPTPEPPASKVEAPVYSKKGSEFAEADALWADKGKPEHFSFQENAKVGGAHAKEFWTDEHGRKWLFKPVKTASDDFIAHGEEAAYKIGRLLDPQAIEVRSIRLNGRTGSIQPWRTDLKDKFDFGGVSPVDLTPDEIAQVQREHVLDWLIANHDGHAKQFLRGKDGHIYGIDKAQLFKHLGEDRLEIGYHPNGKFGEQEPFYHTLFRAVKEGKVTVDPQVTLRAIREIEKIPDENYLALIRPYAEGRFAGNETGKRAFLEAALSRKHNLQRDFEQFYADVLKQKNFRFVEAKAAPKAQVAQGGREIMEEIPELGWQGKAIPFDEDMVEDQNLLVYMERHRGRERTVMKMKIRPERERLIMQMIEKADIEDAAKVAKVGNRLPEDKFADDILEAVKTINHHATDKNYNTAKIDKAMDHWVRLQELAKDDDRDIREMAIGYLDWLEKINKASHEESKIDGIFTTYLKQFESAAPKPKSKIAYRVRKDKVQMNLRQLRDGDIVVLEDKLDNEGMFRGSTSLGQQYEIEFDDGVKAVYRPWNAGNPYAQQGEFEIYLPERPSAKTLERAMERMDELGIKSGLATPEDTELLYLHKQAYLSKEVQNSDYSKLARELDKKGASKEERVRELRGYWERKLSVDDLTQMPGYDPMGEYQRAFKVKEAKAGFRHQMRFDISDEEMEKQMKGYSLYHNLTNNDDLPAFVDLVLGNNGAMISTVEKARIGVKVGGMSPSADMKSGGANYFFTRIRKLPTEGRSGEAGFYFKKRMLRRMDAISYNHDAYGKVVDEYVLQHRGANASTWKDYSHNSSNETIFKNSVTLLDNIDMIVVKTNQQRQKLLAVFKKHGIMKLPDGRAVEDIVLSKGS